MASYRKRNGSWVLDWREDGKRKRETLGPVAALSEREVRARAKQKELDLYHRTHKLVIPTFEDFVKDYLEWHAHEYPSSHRRIKQIVDGHLAGAFSLLGLTAIGVQQIDSYKRSRTARPATIIKEIRTLKAILNKAVEWKLIHENPAKHAKPPRDLHDEEIHFYTPEQLEAIYAHAAKHSRWAPAWRLLQHTGMRRGEALNAQWSWIRDGKITVVSTEEARTKSGKKRVIPLSKGAQAALEELKRDGPYLLPRIHPNKLSNRFERHAEVTGAGGSLHWLRHTFISYLVMRGVPLRTVQELAGHASITTTMRYAHLAPGHLKNSVEVLDL